MTEYRAQFLRDELLEGLERIQQEYEVVLTLSQGKPNRIISVEPAGVRIETQRTKERGDAPQLVPAWMIERAWTELTKAGTLTQQRLVSTEELNVKRSAAVLALLSHLPGVTVASSKPSRLDYESGRPEGVRPADLARELGVDPK